MSTWDHCSVYSVHLNLPMQMLLLRTNQSLLLYVMVNVVFVGNVIALVKICSTKSTIQSSHLKAGMPILSISLTAEMVAGETSNQ